jgi:hypothetical protein
MYRSPLGCGTNQLIQSIHSAGGRIALDQISLRSVDWRGEAEPAMNRVGLMVAIVLLAGVVDSAPGQVQAGSKASGEALTKGSEKGFPSRPLRYIVPFPPGGSTDIVARIVAAALTDGLGEQVVIDNRGGAAGTIGAEIAARATP